MKVISSPNFEKSLNKLPKNSVNRIGSKISDLAAGKENLDIKKLKTGNDYRLRVGDYRIIFENSLIDDEVVIVLHTVEHQKDAYKKRK